MAEEDKKLSRAERRKRQQGVAAPEVLGSGIKPTGGQSGRPRPAPTVAATTGVAAGTTLADTGPTPGQTQIAGDFASVEQRAQANANANRAPLPSQQDTVVQVPDQITQQRGPETQLTRLGAFDSQGNPIGVQSNQRNQASSGSVGTTLGDASGTGAGTGAGTTGQRDVFQQLAALRSLREPSGSTGGTPGGFAVAPDSRTRERNARIRDPNRKLIEQLDRDVRRGAISARAARGIQQKAISNQTDAQIARERIGTGTANEQAALDFKNRQLAQQGRLGQAEIERRSTDSTADRLAKLQEAGLDAQTAQAKLGEDVAKRTQQESQFQRTQALDLGKFEANTKLKIAELAQEASIAGDRDTRERLDQATTVLEKAELGGLQPQQAVSQIIDLIGKERARILFPGFEIKENK